ncbi:hypothetical protein ACER0C_002638 [Sarotherodon galilaeus]
MATVTLPPGTTEHSCQTNPNNPDPRQYETGKYRLSQHALAVVVEVNEGERSVQLPCLFSGFIPEDSTLMWNRSDLDPKSVHLRREGGDDVRGQNQCYSRRTSMNRYAFITKDFSLTLRKPTKTDSGNYTCSISAGGEERRLRDIQLQVKGHVLVKNDSKVPHSITGGQAYELSALGYVFENYTTESDEQKMVTVREGSKSVILPCSTKPNVSEDTTVEWTRSDLGLIMVDAYPNRNDDPMTQDDLYTNRTKMNEDLLRTGDLSLTLKKPTERDSGGYICTIHKDKDILRQKVVLQVKVYIVEVDSGVESVLLPCKAIVRFLENPRVEWKDRDDRTVHVYENGCDQHEQQHRFYRGRTEMNRNPLEFRDLSLTLKHPTDDDNSTYTCTIYSREGKTLKKKQVELRVRVPQVDVDSGEASILLPCKTTQNLPRNAKIEWWDRFNRKVHMYENGSDQLEDQGNRYRDRTQINEDLLETGDLSLTLKYPTDWDADIYTCTVCNREGKKILMKQVELKVRVCEVEVEEGAESVQLPYKTTENPPEDAKVVWWDIDDRKVHVFNNGSHQSGEQHQVYRDRTEMNEDLLRTGDLSLTLKQPTVRDSGGYRCRVYGEIKRYKRVLLRVKGRDQVQDQTGDIRNRSSSTDLTPLMADQSREGGLRREENKNREGRHFSMHRQHGALHSAALCSSVLGRGRDLGIREGGVPEG